MQREYMRGAEGLPGAPGSTWLAAETPEHHVLTGEREADAVVVGGGLVGALVAAELTTRGLHVAVLERGRFGYATTGHSTAKVTALHGTDWSTVVRTRGTGAAAQEWASRNALAPRALGEIVSGLGIECRFRTLDGYLCERPRAGEDDSLVREWQALRALGIPVDDVEAIPGSPFGGVVALRLADQAQLDPAALTTGVFATLPPERCWLHEGTAVRSIARDGGMWVARADGGSVRAPLVVMASLAPARDPAALFARLFPYAHYAIEVAPSVPPADGLWIQATGSELTARPTDAPDGTWILSGRSERLAFRSDERALYRELIAEARAEFGTATVTRYWSAEDFSTPDGLPFAGQVGPLDGLYYIGGFGGWGLSKSVVAAALVADDIEGIAPRELMRLLSPNRFPAPATWPDVLHENVSTARHLLFPMPAQLRAEAPAPPVVPDAGAETPRCTHLGCRTKVNTAEGTIDCPCHGSRFDADGWTLYGPARRDLHAKEPEHARSIRDA